MDIKQLRSFCTVAEKGGFSVAAKALGVSQPTVSFQVSSLEDELGTKLFDRRGRTSTITKSGEVLYQYSRRILELSSEAEQAIEQLKGLVRGRLIIGASTIPGEYILPDLLRRFRLGFPGIEVQLIVDDTKGITKRVIENEVELGIVGAAEKTGKLVYTKFVTDKLVLVAPANNGWFGKTSATLEELRKVPVVVREVGSGTRTSMEQKLKQLGVSKHEFNVAMTLGSTAAVIRAVECGAGVSVVSERAVERDVELGLVEKLDMEGIDMERDFFIVYRRQKAHSPAAAALLQFIDQEKAIL